MSDSSPTHGSFAQALSASRHTLPLTVPLGHSAQRWVSALLGTLFPHFSDRSATAAEEIEAELRGHQDELLSLLQSIQTKHRADTEIIAEQFFDRLPTLYGWLMEDAAAIYDGDPAATSVDEVILAYPGFFAIAVHRIAHQLHGSGAVLLPRVLSEFAHEKTGIDIHPGASIGRSFCIDHGTGIVIGETTIIEDRVKLYQGVTLGALSVDKDQARTKRHPTIEAGVVIYAHATILGGATVVGAGSVIGGNVWLTTTVPPGSTVYHRSDAGVRSRSDIMKRQVE